MVLHLFQHTDALIGDALHNVNLMIQLQECHDATNQITLFETLHFELHNTTNWALVWYVFTYAIHSQCDLQR